MEDLLNYYSDNTMCLWMAEQAKNLIDCYRNAFQKDKQVALVKKLTDYE
jgi:hypothetical protein